jgi:hypothetical protein
MQATTVNLGRGLAILLGAAVGTAAFAQPPDKPAAPPAAKPAALAPEKGQGIRNAAQEDSGAAHRMVIYEGPNRKVAYFDRGGSPGEQAALMDLERAENDMTYLHNLQALRRQYVNSERILEPQRRYVQEQLYGTQISYGQSNVISGYSFGGGYGYGGYGYYPYVNSYSPYSNGYGGGLSGYVGASATQITRSLANGMGDEGVLKNAMAQVIAQQAASPEYAATVTRNYQAALGEVMRSDRLARDLRLPRARAGEGVPVGPPEPKFEKGPFVLTLKGGDKVDADEMAREGDWMVLKTRKGTERIRESEVTRIAPK